MLELYTTPLSANGRKVMAVCHHLGLEPEMKITNVYRGEGRSPEYLAINPSGQIPTLLDGDLTLCESNAILQYLSEAYGDFELWSRDPKRRADISRWLFWESSQWQPALIPVLIHSVRQQLQSESTRSEPIDVNWNDERFLSVARRLDAQLSGRAFIVGDEITLADFSVGAMMMYVRSARFPFAAFANIDAWYSRIESLHAWRATAAGPWRY